MYKLSQIRKIAYILEWNVCRISDQSIETGHQIYCSRVFKILSQKYKEIDVVKTTRKKTVNIF